MGNRKDPNQLRKLMLYALGRRPDEFGLVPDGRGFVRIKDLVRAVAEEPGWGYVRRTHIDETLGLSGGDFAVEADLMATRQRDEEAIPIAAVEPPKLLYHCVRRKTYPVVLENGIFPVGCPAVYLAATEAMAMRMGRRRDSKPVLLTVQARRAFEGGVDFARQGCLLYIADRIPTGYFTGPPLPKQKTDRSADKEPAPDRPDTLPGSFFLDMDRSNELHKQAVKEKGRKKDIGWKRDARKLRHKHRDRQ